MPTFQQIYSNFNKAKEKQLIGPDESLSDYAKKVMAITGDPSYQSVAEGGTIGNWVRSRSADLTELVNAGPVDEWLGEGTKFVGDFFGIDPKTSRAVGESLPRMAVDYLPLAVGGALAPFTGGASLAPGLAMTSGLSAASGYEQAGEISDAIIGGAAPYVGGKLSEIGGKAALNLVPKSQILKRLGFTGGTQVTGRALTAGEQASMVANREVTEAVAKATTKSFTELDKPLDKLLHYVGGEALANVGFTGLDIAQQGTDAVFNRDYLFANLVSNIPFAAADLAGSFANRPVGEVKYNLPEVKPQYLSPGEERAVYAAAMFKDLESPEAIAQWRKRYGLDMADIAIKTEEVKMALDAKESGLRTAETNFVSKWNELSKQNPELNINPIQPEEIPNAIGQAELPIAFKDAVEEFKSQTSLLKGKFNAVIDKVGTPVNTVESLQKGVQELGLDEFLNTPIEERDYAKALEGTFVSLDGADLIRDIHRSEAGLQPLRADLFEQYSKLVKGEDVSLTPDKHMEVIVAASLASGKKPVFEVAKRKAREAVQEGQPDEVIVKEALKGMKEGNREVFRQPVIPDETLSGLTDLGQGSNADLRRGMVMRPGVQQQFIPDQVESGLTQGGEVAQVDLVKNLARKEVRPQVEQTVVERLVASIPAKWPDEVKNVVAEFYKTGDDTQLKNLGTDKDSELRKKIAYRSLREADPTYEKRLQEWEKVFNEEEAKKQKLLNSVPVHEEEIDSDLQVTLKDYEVRQEMIPEEFFRAEDWSRVKDQDKKEYLVPVPEGEFQQVEQFARGLMSKLVSPEMLPESSKELVDLAKLFNNPEAGYAELGKTATGKELLAARREAIDKKALIELNEEVKQLEKQYPGKTVALRFGELPENEVSTGVSHSGQLYEEVGISTAGIFGVPGQQLVRETNSVGDTLRSIKDRTPYLIVGDLQSAKGRNKEPLLRNVVYSKQVPSWLVIGWYEQVAGVKPGSYGNYLRSDAQFAQTQEAKIYGAASYKVKQILINSKAFQDLRASDRAAFIFAHEQSHISFAKAIEGKYGPQAKIQAEKALAWVNAADPQAKKNVEDVLKELHLDKDLAQMDGIRDVLNNPDPQEWLANVMGMYGFGAVKSKAPKQAFAMLPKPVREFAEWLISHLQNLTKGAVTWLKLAGKNYQGAKHTKELFDSIRRSYRQAEWDAAQAERFLDIEPSSMLERGNEFAFARSQVKELKFDEAPKAVIGTWWNKIIQPIHTLANAHKEFVEPVMAVMNAHSDTSNAIGDVFKVVTGELDGNDKLRMTNKAFKRVFGSEPLAKLFNAIQTRSRVMNRRMLTVDDVKNVEVLDMTALSPELRGRVAQFNPEAQQALVTMIAQAERANKLTQLKNLEADWQGSVHNLATLLAAKPSFAGQDYKKAVEISKGMMEDLKVGDVENALSKVTMLDETDQARAMEQAQDIFKQYANLEKFYQDHPTFMSFRRFGKIKQRIQKAGEQDDVIDADSEGELQEMLKIYKAKGWTEKGSRIEESKNFQRQYEINSGLLKVMNEKEQAFREMIQNEVNLSDDLKKKILSAPTASEAMMKEINSRELYRPKVGTKFVGDLERFDWWEQFQRYTPAAIAAAQRRALGAKVNFWMQNPALNDMQLQKDQFMNLYEQSKQPDPEWARKLNKLNAVWHIGWNLPGHIAEVFQPMLSGVHEFVAKGESLPGALKLFWKAEKETARMHAFGLKDKLFSPDKAKFVYNKGKDDEELFEGLPAVWLKANGATKENLDIARMLHAKRDRIQKAPLSELRDFTGENHAKLQDSLDGKKQRSLGEIIASPFMMYANAAMNFYSNFTRHNGVVTMVAAYRKFRKDGNNGKPMTHEEAMQAAELFDLTVNNSGGRLERPEMFGKLGGAGHLPYGLTSYTRGRFSQLATYYRHGFDAKQFEGKLSPVEIKNAKKAFQTMILAQLGAAGILGMPFVGAGIALMEDLLDEDIKGKMINALDEVTNDPLLTRMFTHGMMSTIAESVGVPADLHSRFALSSFLGTNSYDGMSAKSFMGPSVAMLDSMFNLGGQIAQGEKLEKALTVAGPGGVKRLSEALSEDFRKDNPEANLTMSMLGFRSSQQVKRKEWEQITRKQELETRKKLTESATLISKAMAVSPQEGRKQLLIEAEKLLPKGLDYQATMKQRQQNVKDLIQKVSLIEADKVGPQDVRREISGRLAPVASQTAQSMGVQMPDPIEMARSMAQQKTRSQLGATSSQRPVRNAMLRDMQWERNPWSF